MKSTDKQVISMMDSLNDAITHLDTVFLAAKKHMGDPVDRLHSHCALSSLYDFESELDTIKLSAEKSLIVLTNIIEFTKHKTSEIEEYIASMEKCYDENENTDVVKNISPFSLCADINWADDAERAEKINRIDRIVDRVTSDQAAEKRNWTTKGKTVAKPRVKYLDAYENVHFGVNLRVPAVNSLDEMQPALYYFRGGKDAPAGLYACITDNFRVRVPFPDVDSGGNPIRTMRCPNASLAICGDSDGLQGRNKLMMLVNAKKAAREDARNGISTESAPRTTKCNNAHAGTN